MPSSSSNKAQRPIPALLRRLTLAAGLGAAAHAQAATGPVPEPAALAQDVPVVAVVNVPAPWYAADALISKRMKATTAEYQAAPGLLWKYYTLADNAPDLSPLVPTDVARMPARADTERTFGGIYLWKDARAAGNWFGPAWFERVRKSRGVDGRVRLFEAPVVLDNTPTRTDPASLGGRYAVATLLTVPMPAGLSRETLIAAFRASIPTYRAVEGLQRKYFIITADGRMGGIYLWRSLTDAQAHFTPAALAAARTRYGAAPVLEWFEVPLVVAGQTGSTQ
jgi:hypothetical protein